MKRLLLTFLVLTAVLLAQDKEPKKEAVKQIPIEYQLKYWKLVADSLAAEVNLKRRTEELKAAFDAEADRVGKEVKALAAEAGQKAGCVAISVKDGLACQEKK